VKCINMDTMNTMNKGLSGKRLFIIGAGIFQTPAIKKAKEMGLKVITADKNPQSEGFQYADHYEIVSTHDSEALLSVAQKYHVEGVMTLSTEIAVVPTAYVGERLHLHGLTVDVARKATDKYLMRKAFKENGVPCPEFYLIKNSEDLKDAGNVLRFPLMVKPTTGYASKGILKVNNKRELEKAFSIARDESTGGSVLVEEFITGREVGGESFTVNGTTSMIYITNKKITKPPQYIPLGHSLPSILQEDTVKKIKNIVKKGIKAFETVVCEHSENADLVITGFSLRKLEEQQGEFFSQRYKLVNRIADDDTQGFYVIAQHRVNFLGEHIRWLLHPHFFQVVAPFAPHVPQDNTQARTPVNGKLHDERGLTVPEQTVFKQD